MSDTVQNGKGSRARNIGPKFKSNFDTIDWRPDYRLIDDGESVYVIRADEVQVFCKWCCARKGQRHFRRTSCRPSWTI